MTAADSRKAANLLMSVSTRVDAQLESGWGDRPLLLRLVPLFASGGLLGQAERLRRGLADRNGLDALIDPLINRQLHEEGRLTESSGRVREMADQVQSDTWFSAHFFVDLANDPATRRASRLLSLHYWHCTELFQLWRRDDVKALWAAHVTAFDLPAACRVADSIDNRVLRQLTMLTLAKYGLPVKVLQQDGGWHPPLAPLAFLLLAADEANPGKKGAWLDFAYKAATTVPSLGLQAEELDLLLEFVHEATPLRRREGEGVGLSLGGGAEHDQLAPPDPVLAADT